MSVKLACISGYEFIVDIDLENDDHINFILDRNVQLKDAPPQPHSEGSSVEDLDLFLESIDSDLGCQKKFKECYDEGIRFIVNKTEYEDTRVAAVSREMTYGFWCKDPDKTSFKTSVDVIHNAFQLDVEEKYKVADIHIQLKSGKKFDLTGLNIPDNEAHVYSDIIRDHGFSFRHETQNLSISPDSIALVIVDNIRDAV